MSKHAPLPRIALINPNTDASVTADMTVLAQRAALLSCVIEGHTVTFGVPLITNEAALSRAAEAVVELGALLPQQGYDGIIIAAFGDPGLAALRVTVPVPVVGLAESGMAEAALGGRRFSVVTTTPDLRPAIRAAAEHYACAHNLLSIRIARSVPASLAGSPAALTDTLFAACEEAIGEDGAEAVLIGGGPLASQAGPLSRRLSIPVIDPVSSAVLRVTRTLISAVGPM